MGPEFTVIIVLSLMTLVVLGMEIADAIGIISFVGIAYIMGDFNVALSLLSNTAYESLRNYIYAVIPLFILMGEFVSRSGAASDLYNLVNRSLKGLPGRLAVATVGGNAVFAAVTGVSIASAATFTRIAYPEMVRHRYNKAVALGSIAGSASLGMLIPPSVLLIVWGVVTEESIGKLFLAGVIPGIALALMFVSYIIGFAIFCPGFFGGGGELASGTENPVASGSFETSTPSSELFGAAGIIFLILLVMGGIWLGWFTPTEAAGIGALGGLVLAVAKGMKIKGVFEAIMETGKTSAPILFLLITAQMYTRLLTLGGIIDTIQETLQSAGLTPAGTLAVMVLMWFILGMFIDSISIILLTVPIFAGVAGTLGFDQIAFAIIGVVAIEAGLLTPPFGICVYTVRSCVDDPDVTLSTIFLGSSPYWVILLLLVVLVAVFPSVATWLPSTML